MSDVVSELGVGRIIERGKCADRVVIDSGRVNEKEAAIDRVSWHESEVEDV